MASPCSLHPLPVKPIPFLPNHESFPMHRSLLSIKAKPNRLATAASSSPLPVTKFGPMKQPTYEEPPLACFFGAAQREFVPGVRVSDWEMDPDQYSDWKMVQWDPPDFARAPGGPSINVAAAHVRLGGRAEFMGKLGYDDLGIDLLYELYTEKVQLRAVEFTEEAKTGASYMKLEFRDRKDGMEKKLVAETVKESAEDSFVESDINVDVLKEVCSHKFLIVASPSICVTSALYSATILA
jgi:pfkB family carbohydrate kinase